MSDGRARENVIAREECSVCGAEVRGHVWSCNHPHTDPGVTGRPQERTPTMIRRYVSLDAVVDYLWEHNSKVAASKVSAKFGSGDQPDGTPS